MRLLAVDDSATIRHALSITFSDPTLFHLTLASTAAEALRLARARVAPLVLLDTTLPDGDSYDLCRQLRSELPQLTIVMLSSKQTPYDDSLGASAGAHDVIVKPFDTQPTIDKITRLARAHSLLPPEPPPPPPPMTPDELRQRIEAELRLTLAAELRPRIEAEARARAAAELADSDEGRLRARIEAELRPALVAELEKSVEARLRARVDDELRKSVAEELRPSVERKVLSEYTDKLRLAIAGELRPGIEAEVRLGLAGELRAQVAAELHQQIIDGHFAPQTAEALAWVEDMGKHRQRWIQSTLERAVWELLPAMVEPLLRDAIRKLLTDEDRS